MYTFATALLMGLAVAKLVDLLAYAVKMPDGIRLGSPFLVGLGIAWAANWSMFTDWMIGFRHAWMGPVATGIVIGGLAALWRDILNLISSHARHAAEKTPGPRMRKVA